MLEFRTQGFNGYSVKYSPFFDSRIAVASAANFGLVGNGRLYVLGLTAKGIVAEKWFDTQDALYSLAWSEAHESQLVAAAGDGSIKLFDIALDQFPIQSWQEHKREVFAVHWNLVAKDTFCSSSWDGCVKIVWPLHLSPLPLHLSTPVVRLASIELTGVPTWKKWSPERAESLVTLPTHSCTYSAAFSPHSPSILSAVSSDSHLRVFDLRTPASASNHLTLSVPLHAPPASRIGVPPSRAVPPAEALTHDWNKYRDTVVAAAGVDRTIRTFDIRAPNRGPIAVLPGHGYAVRQVAWSPHLPDVLLSASYDMSCRLWTDGSAMGHGQTGPADATTVGGGKELGRMDNHTEFVVGVDWCLFGAEGWCASCGWDERVLVWDARATMR